MPRRARFNLPEVPLHIVQRGNNRQPTFFADDDYAFYRECLRDSAQQHACDVHAYVLMTNHVHLLVTPYTANGASRLMQSLGRRYVQYINYTYRRSGTLWEGRFKASLVESEAYLLTCYRYIELNPVRARMVEAPGAYRWSSYGYHALGAADPVVRDHPLFIALGPSEEERRSAYCELFRHQLEPGTLGQIRQSLNDGLVLGTEGFKERIEKMLHRLLRVPVRGRPRKCVAREHRVASYHRTGSQK
jgi:putative transposase